MSAPQCSVCGLEGVRLYRPMGIGFEPPVRVGQWARCNGHVPERPASSAWVPHVPELEEGRPIGVNAIGRAMLAWIALPEAAPTPVWWQRVGWIDIENAPGAT